MANAVIRGVRSTEDILQNIRPLHWDEKVYQLNPDKAPLTRLISQIKREEVYDPEYNWFEDTLLGEWDAVTNNAGTNTTLAVSNKEYFSTGDVIKVPSTGETILVITATGSGAGNITVRRAVGTTSAVAIDGSGTAVPILNLGNSSEEFSGKPEIKTTTKTKVYNYCEIIKTPFGVSGTLNATKLRTGNELDYQRAKGGIEQAKRVEKKLWFGERGEDTNGDEVRRFTGGVLSFISALSTPATFSALTEAVWDEFVRQLFRYGADKKIVFASSYIISLINGWSKGKLQTFGKDKTYGVNIYQLISPHGELGLVNMKELFTGAYYGGLAVGLDMNNVAYKYLKGRDTRLFKSVQNNDIDGQTDMFMGEVGLKLAQADAHGYLLVSDTGSYY